MIYLPRKKQWNKLHFGVKYSQKSNTGPLFICLMNPFLSLSGLSCQKDWYFYGMLTCDEIFFWTFQKWCSEFTMNEVICWIWSMQNIWFIKLIGVSSNPSIRFNDGFRGHLNSSVVYNSSAKKWALLIILHFTWSHLVKSMWDYN